MGNQKQNRNIWNREASKWWDRGLGLKIVEVNEFCIANYVQNAQSKTDLELKPITNPFHFILLNPPDNRTQNNNA